MKTGIVKLIGARTLPIATAIALAICLCQAVTVRATTYTIGNLPNINHLSPLAEFGRVETESNVHITGDVGVANGGTLTVMAPSTISGNVYLGTGASVSGAGSWGTVFGPSDLSAWGSQVYSASSTLLGMNANADAAYATLNSSLTISGLGANDVYVLNVGDLNLNDHNITLSGDGYLVINVTGDFGLTGTASILAAGGSDASHIFINWTGTGTMGTHVGDVIDGYVFMPNGDANLDGKWYGGLYGGTNRNQTISLLSGATVNNVPQTNVPDGGITAALLGLALLSMGGLSRKCRV